MAVASLLFGRSESFQNTDIVILQIIWVGIIGFGFDLLKHMAERHLVPWKGKA